MTALDKVRALIERGGVVKLCGLRAPNQAVAAVAAGADLLGFVFAESRRRVTPSVAAASVNRARRVAGDRPILAVGVFVDQPAADIEAVARFVGLDAVQLHGGDDPSVLADVDVPVIVALRTVPGTRTVDLERTIDALVDRPRPAVAVLLDGFSASAAGGTGVRADWSIAAELAACWPLMLAGGLRPENVEAAIATVRPVGVDVSSGVETEGVKDVGKMAAFVVSARAGFERAAAERTSAPAPRRPGLNDPGLSR